MLDSEYGQDPQGRLRFYGIYSAKVTNVTDPLKKNRVQVQVYLHQLLQVQILKVVL